MENGVVDVWRADLDAPGEDLAALLSDEERERAARFARADDGRRWARSRGILRALLASYLAADGGALVLSSGEHGKPRIAGSWLRFSLSHSAGLALYAVARDREVGVDVEARRRPLDAVAIARRALGAGAAARLEGLGPDARERELRRLWTRLEAELKCRGVGLSGERAGPPVWVADVEVGPDAAGAVAVEGAGCEIRLREWPGSA